MLLVVAGPTASGKSLLALSLACTLGGEIVNADSQQLYRDLPILSALPSVEDFQRIPHHLYGIFPFEEPCSVGKWCSLAETCLSEIHQRQHLPILVGGTGLYLKAFLEGLRSIPQIPPAVRQEVRERFVFLGKADFWQELCTLDPLAATHVRPTDTQRLQRAYEVMRATGRSLFSWMQETPQRSVCIVIILPPREDLYTACNTRFALFLERGALEEVRTILHDLPPSLHAQIKTIGFQELRQYLEGKISLEEAVLLAQQHTRQYAKRQITWFRHQLTAHHIIPYRITAECLPETCTSLVPLLNEWV
ncbi:MAG: tRNA (adenosine(37)-N6)-dimethylallyltransferase MiaA [Holosporales bacterium]|nr:tRNA (adenosine(37)-N6)-dimethylallyltransferase MiaA [Holosporales bacterium]